jgi:energy-coupling factor transporter transmembrane protein EcfT
MLAMIALLVVLALFGAGFVLKVLWIAAIVALVLWALGFLARSADASWYRW